MNERQIFWNTLLQIFCTLIMVACALRLGYYYGGKDKEEQMRKPRPMADPAERKTNATMPEDQEVNSFIETAEEVAASSGAHIWRRKMERTENENRHRGC